MANFNGLQLDANVEENLGSATVVPAGKYKIVLTGDEIVDNSKKTGKILKLKLQIIEGQFAQETLKDSLNIVNPHKISQAIGQGTLKRICNLCNIVYPPRDTTGLMGKPMVVKVIVDKFKSDQGNEIQTNKIKAYESADTEISENQSQPQEPAQTQTPANSW